MKLALLLVLPLQVSCSEQAPNSIGGNRPKAHAIDGPDAFEGWRSSAKEVRHEHLSSILGDGWYLDLANELVDLESSPLSGLRRGEVVERLGKPDATTRWGVMYDVGYVAEPSPGNQAVGAIIPGMKVKPDTLIIDFADDNGSVNRIILSN